MSQAEEPIVEVDDDDVLYRRLGADHVKPDGSVNSNAFKLRGKPDPEPLLDLAKLTSPEESLSRASNESFQLGVLLAGDIRRLGLKVRHQPVEGNKAHCVIEGNSSKESCRKLANITKVLKGVSG